MHYCYCYYSAACGGCRGAAISTAVVFLLYFVQAETQNLSTVTVMYAVSQGYPLGYTLP